MKFSKRTGALLLAAVGASAVAGQGAAQAAPASPMTPGQVAALEDGLATRTVPLRVPLETVTQHAPMLPLGGDINGALPASPVLPPVPSEQGKHEMMPDQVVPPLNFSKVGPSLDTAVPLPALADGVRPGSLGLDSPAAPLKAVGPAVGVGHPLSFVEGADGKLQDGALSTGDLDPRLVPAAVSALPGADAKLGGPDKQTPLTDQAQKLLGTASAALDEATAE
ncbi:hypothetical protein C7C46_05280 [Streptomyces tateyamensis]|uniref:ATP-binding protein n=1 Tax=Streptomyces tateyamensis TaxID=565073 RepID=A0A2V4P1C4_9ACTN|nr:hypothetical protein [Streptomyces tateyamensis]PYC86904.1 hypothetical protein C7C46_05280 [Streptomyces tateyamensis]